MVCMDPVCFSEHPKIHPAGFIKLIPTYCSICHGKIYVEHCTLPSASTRQKMWLCLITAFSNLAALHVHSLFKRRVERVSDNSPFCLVVESESPMFLVVELERERWSPISLAVL